MLLMIRCTIGIHSLEWLQPVRLRQLCTLTVRGPD